MTGAASPTHLRAFLHSPFFTKIRFNTVMGSRARSDSNVCSVRALNFALLVVILIVLQSGIFMWLPKGYCGGLTIVARRWQTGQGKDPGSSDQLVDSTLPAPLHEAAFNQSLGCWHIRKDAVGATATLHVATEANFVNGSRWEEVQKAMNMTHTSNPGVHYILVTSTIQSLQLLRESAVLSGIPHDVWYCSEVLYGTPIAIGNLYKGTKFACSIDNWFPKFNWDCKFNSGGQQIVYAVQRSETKELAGSDYSCDFYKGQGSADGLMFEYMAPDVYKWMRFPRNYWGCENVAMHVVKRAGIKLVNLCPFFAPSHVHKVDDRSINRVRVNHPVNNAFQGDNADMNSLCTAVPETPANSTNTTTDITNTTANSTLL